MAAGNEWNGSYINLILKKSFSHVDYESLLETLCGCFKDLRSCLCGCFCTPCLFGLNAEKTDESSCVFMCCLYAILSPCYLCWLPHCTKRQDLRMIYNLREDPCPDCPTTCCCSPCALCQEARFLKRRSRSNNERSLVL